MICAAVTVLMYRLTSRVWSDRGELEARRIGRIAAWMYALSPHMAFFAMSLWSEVIYGMILLFLRLTLDKARDALEHGVRQFGALAVSSVASVCSFVASLPMVPIFVFTLLWRRFTSGRAWQQADLGRGSRTDGRTYSSTFQEDGCCRHLGSHPRPDDGHNNSFDPITSTTATDSLSACSSAHRRRTRVLRRMEATIKRDTCETQAGKDSIFNNLPEFVDACFASPS